MRGTLLWAGRVTLAGTLSFLSLLLMGGAIRTESLTPCAAADQSVTSGKLASATSLYEVLGNVGCARQGRRTVETLRQGAAGLVMQAREKIAQGTAESIAGGRKLAGLALALDPENTAAKSITDQATPPVPEALCRAAEKLIAQGDLDTATRLYNVAKAGEATKVCASEGLAGIAETREQGLPQRVFGLVSGGLNPWLQAALLVALGMLVLSMVVGNLVDPRFTSRAWRIVWVRRSVLGGMWISGGAIVTFAVLFVVQALGHTGPPWPPSLEARGVWLVGAAFVFSLCVGAAFVIRPRLAFKSFTGTKDLDAADIAALVSAEFSQMCMGAAAGVDQVRDSDLEASPFAKTFDLVKNPVATSLLSIWKTLTPGIDLSLSAHVHQPDTNNLVAAVSLRHASRTIASESINLKALTDHDNANFHDLATAVAAWVIMQLKLTNPRLYGASRWQSLALTAIAARRQPTDEAVRPLLAKALNHDGQNLAAEFGLATAWLRQLDTDQGGEDYKRVIKTLNKVRRDLSQPATDYLPLSWRVDYSYVVAVANWMQLKLRNAGTSPAQRKAATKWDDEKMGPNESDVSAVVGNLRIKLGNVCGGKKPEGGLVDSDVGLARHLLALTLAADRAIKVTQAAIEMKSLGTILRPLLKEEAGPVPRVQYNLACAFGAVYSEFRALGGPSQAQDFFLFDVYFGGQQGTKWLAESIRCLRVATEDPNLAVVAQMDPYLEDVLKSSEYATAIGKLPPVERADYADLDCIGSMVQRLIALGLVTRTALSAALASPKRRADLQVKLGIGDENQSLLQEWRGGLAWLADDIPARHINVVQRSGHADRDSLAAVPASALETQAFVRHRVLGYEEATPSRDDLRKMGAQ